MLTKGDLAAIQSMFDSLKKETNKRLENMDKKFTSKFDDLSNRLQKNTGELIELITYGFNASNYDSRLQEQNNILDNHEKRIGRIEEKTFKAN
ncbi:MAG: hypothetical protein WC894_01705 [Patescibacteria group bacterium]